MDEPLYKALVERIISGVRIMIEPVNQNSFLLPAITDLKSAQSAGRQGTAVCALIVVSSLIFLQIQLNGAAIPPEAIAELVIYTLIGGMIFRMSRVAAVLGLAFYWVGRIILIVQGGFPGMSAIVMILFSFAFINSIRGTFAFHRIRQERRSEIESPEVHANN